MHDTERLMEIIGALGGLVNNLCELGIVKEDGKVTLPDSGISWRIGDLLDEVNTLLEGA